MHRNRKPATSPRPLIVDDGIAYASRLGGSHMADVEDGAPLLDKQRSIAAESAKLEAHYHETQEIANLRLWWGLCYANAMGVCGIVLVALGSTLSSLAEDCGTTATAVGTVFIARGVGAITALSSALYAPPRRGNHIMVVVLLALSAVLLYMPFVHDVWVLHVTWFLMGLCTATLDTGCQIMTRKVHGVHAGPWLGANTVCFAIAGALVPLIEIITGELFAQYATLATISVLNAAALYAAPHPETPEIKAQLPPRVGANGKGDKAPKALPPRDQINLKKQPTRAIFVHLTAWLFTGTFGMLLTTIFPNSGVCFWLGLSLYGLGNGPCVGYCYDLVNRMTIATEEGMSIVMFGLNFGASLVPYLTTVFWDYTGVGADILIWTTLVSMFAALAMVAAGVFFFGAKKAGSAGAGAGAGAGVGAATTPFVSAASFSCCMV
ncbi:hypothetical protein JL722_7204 [Aureococcus anophagefferens]|nr:hypothetical protein JL722_7204 [Aureococcus anophagefferens]